MKLNQELVKRLAAGEIQLKNTGTLEQLNEILKAAFPYFKKADGGCEFYGLYKGHKWSGFYNKSEDIPTYTTEQFFEAETDHVPDVRKTMDAETRELAKQLFVAKMYAGNLPIANAMKQAIDNAKQFIQLLNNE